MYVCTGFAVPVPAIRQRDSYLGLGLRRWENVRPNHWTLPAGEEKAYVRTYVPTYLPVCGVSGYATEAGN